MSNEDAFAIWSPDGVLWSEWAKPIAFVQAGQSPATPAAPLDDAALPVLPALPFPDSAVVIDLPGADAVHAALSLADRGFRPVPLFNGTSGPSPVVDVTPISGVLTSGAERLRRATIRPDAPPAFLLDSRRDGTNAVAAPGKYDNRWVALPQDFPSGALLASRGIRTVTVILRGTSIARDLTHVLRRWQEAGIQVRVCDVTTGLTTNVTVPKPSQFRLAWYAALAMMGFRRSFVGGFGSVIPEETARSGFHG